MLPSLLWLLTLVCLGVATLPLTMRTFAGLPDRGYGLSRIVGLVVIGWLAYLSTMLGFTAYVGLTVALIALGVGAAGWIAWGRETLAELHERRRLIVAEEVAFVAVFALATLVRAYNADIIGQEKFMDYAFVNALLRTSTLPAEDMWLAGATMPYYYLGYLLAGLPAKIAGTPGPVAYNLAVVLVFATGFSACISIVYALVARRPAPPAPKIVSPPSVDLAVADETPAAPAEILRPALEPAPVPEAVAEPVAAGVAPLAVATAGASTATSVAEPEAEAAAESERPAVEPAPAAPVTAAVPVEPAVAVATAPASLPFQPVAFVFAILGGLMTMVLGNFVGPLELISARGWGSEDFWQLLAVKGLQAMPSDGLLPADGGWWWRSSRVIANIQPDGITEFPYFSFLLGDLHPHYVAIPFVLLVVALTLNRWLAEPRFEPLPVLLVTGLALATLIPASTWDVPSFWGIFVLGALADGWRRHRNLDKVKAELPQALAPLAVAAIAVVPYFIGYQSQPLGLGFVRERTPLVSLLIIFGPALLAVALFAAWLVTRHLRAGAESTAAGRILVGLGLMVIGVTLVGQTTMAILLAFLVGIALTGWWTLLAPSAARNAPVGVVFCWLLGVWALVILFGTELIYLRDVFGTRMNTVFKFQYHVWLLLGLAGAAGLGLIWTRSATRPLWRALVVVTAAIIVLPGMVYPLGATWTKSNGFRDQPTLWGDRFLQRASPIDYQAIEWLRSTAVGRPVVVEAVGGDYTEAARVSTFSGLPTLMGWVGHELQWRGDRPELRTRPADVDAVYRATTQDEIARLAEKYGIRYLFFGTLERAKYGPDAQSRLDRLLPVAYSRGGTTIYLAPNASAAQAVP